MIDQGILPSWPEIFRRIGEPEPRRGRARCVLHGGESPASLSLDEKHGVFHCFVCGASGDKVAFLQKVQGCDFKAVLSFLGIQASGRPPKPDPAAIRERTALAAIHEWCRQTGRQLRDEYLSRQRIARYAQDKLSADPESGLGWELLRIAADGEERCEFLLDAIDCLRTDTERLRAWRRWRNAS